MTCEHADVCRSLADICRKMAVSCVVQVGAEDGHEASYLAQTLGCRSIAIEANAGVSSSPGIEYHVSVIGATNGPTTFYRHSNGALSGHFPRGSEEVAERRWMQRLDAFCGDNLIAPDALIIDTEGSTLEVLEGATGILGGVKVIYAEVQDYPIREGIRPFPLVDAFLAARGFTAHDAAPTYGKGDAQWNQTWVRA